MGVEAQSMRPSVLTAFQNAGFQWTRRNALLWSVVEPLEGQRNWVAVASIERDLSTAASQGIKTILIIRDTPLWAQKVYGHSCGAVKPDKLGVFAVFMKDLVARYSVPPFNVKYWEIGNEPDVDPSLVDADSLFGCWGDLSDPYYGGGYYAEMLKVVYPAIKSADPQANVLNGGLLLDCDPSNPPAGKDCKSALFLKGMLEAGAADYFDILSYHGYPYYHGSWETVETAGTWRARGGYVMGKLAYLREILNAYGVQKPIFLTEGSLTCPEWNTGFCTPPGEAFFEMQGDYAVMLYVRNWAAGISGTFWYGLEGPGWRYTSMLDGGQNPKPDYLALSFLLSELKGAVYRREVFEYENVRGYEFALPDKHVWVLWPKDDNPHHILLPFDALKVYDRAGKAIALASTGVELAHPIYIEFNP